MTNQTAPIFEYDDRYIETSKYTREELYELQEIVLNQIEKNSTTYTYELQILDYDQKEIEIILLKLKTKKHGI